MSITLFDIELASLSSFAVSIASTLPNLSFTKKKITKEMENVVTTF